MESQQTTIKLCCTMLICLSLASVWPRSVDNYSSLALTHKLIMKDKHSSACQLPSRIRSHIKFLPLSTEHLLWVWCSVRGRPIWSWLAVFPLTSVCLRPFYFPLMKRWKKRRRKEGEVQEEDKDTCLWWRLCQFSPLTPLQESPLAALSPAPLSVWLRRQLAGVWRAAVGLRGDSGILKHSVDTVQHCCQMKPFCRLHWTHGKKENQLVNFKNTNNDRNLY